MATPFPTLKVEFAPDDGPLVASPTWVDITQYVLSMRETLNITRGRGSESSSYSPGRCTFKLKSPARLFDHTYTAGTYYGKLLPRRQVRITATWLGVDYILFRGHIQGWPTEYDEGGLEQTVSIVALDALSYLATAPLSDPEYAYPGTVATRKAAYRQADAGFWYDQVGTLNAYRASAVLPTFEDGPFNVNATGVAFSGATAFGNQSVPTSAPSNTTIAFWFRTTFADPAIGSVDIMRRDGIFGTNVTWYINISSAGVLTANYTHLGIPGSRAGSSTEGWNDGKWHHAVVDGVAWYIDGVDHTNGSFSGALAFPGSMGGYWGSDQYPDGSYWGVLAAVDYFAGAFTAAQVATWYGIASGTLAESTAARADRILDDIGWPGALTSLSTTTRGVCLALYTEGASASAALQAVEATEQGRFFVSRDGKVTLLERYYVQEATRGNTAQATFSDDGSDTPYLTYGADLDAREVKNDVTVTTTSTRARETDATSIAANGQSPLSISTILSTGTAGSDMAKGVLQQRKTPTSRSRPISCRPESKVAQWPSVLALELGDRIQHEITPVSTGSQVVQSLTLEQIDWVIKDDDWVLTVEGVPVLAGFFQLDSATLGVLDDDRLGF